MQCVEKGNIIDTIKRPVHRTHLFDSIWTTLEELFSRHDKAKIERVNLSTTVSTNAIEKKHPL